MGRLLKKKDGAKQKKRKQSDDVAPESGQGKTEASGQVSTGGQSAVIKGLPQKRLITGTKVPAKSEKNFIDKSVQFLKEVKIELKKVTWPDRKHTAGSTVVVILVVTIISMILGLMDIGLSSLVKIVLQ